MTSLAADGSPAPRRGRRARAAQLLLAFAVGLVLSDSSVVTLALPAILRDLDLTVTEAAWVLISFNLALALAALPAARAVRGAAPAAIAISIAVFALASLACALAPALTALVAARAVQGIAGAVVVAAALELLVVSAGRDRAVLEWAAAGVLGAALGPAVGGLLTEAFSWRWMFALQVPAVVLGLAGARLVGGHQRAAPAAAKRTRPALAPLVALALASAALSAALFLLVILLIEGWRHSPAVAAATVTVMPLAALLAGRWARRAHGLAPATAGCVLVAGGLAMLGLLPGAQLSWTLLPQVAVGAGLGLALTTLVGATVGGAGKRAGAGAAAAVGGPAAWTIAARHAGIVAGLLLLTPIFTHDLDGVRPPAERAGFAHVLDAPLDLRTKVALARALDAEVEATGADALPDLDRGFARVDAPAARAPALAALRDRLEDELDRAATDAFSRAFLAAAGLALLAALAAAVSEYGRRRGAGAPTFNGGDPQARRLAVAVPAAATVAALLVAGYVALGGGEYEPTPVADPCAVRARPAVDRTQRAALAVLDGASCDLRMPREDVLRTLLDGDLPEGVSNERAVAALQAGVDRAQDEGALSSLTAGALRLALRSGGVLALLGLVFGS